MSRLEELAEQCVGDPFFAAPPIEVLRRARRRHRQHRIEVIVVTSVVALGVALVVGLLPSSSIPGDLGMQVSAASDIPLPATASLLSHTITLGYLPGGFHLVSADISNPTAAELALHPYSQQTTYDRTVASGVESFEVNVVESPALFSNDAPLPIGSLAAVGATSGTSYTITTVDGHRGIEGSASFDALANRCSALVGQHVGAAAPTVTLAWLEGPGVMVQLTSQGLGLSQLRRIASHLSYAPSSYDCIRGDTVIRTSGACAPGVRSSPSGGKPELVVPGGTIIGSGTVGGKRWYYSALASTWRGLSELSYAGASISSSGLCDTERYQISKVPSLGGPEVSVATSTDGARFAFGQVPTSVTRVEASAHGSTVSEATLAKHLWGNAFFVLYLGSRGAACAHLCMGPVTLTFYVGAQVMATVDFYFPPTGPAQSGDVWVTQKNFAGLINGS
jgi:hypothetical protein